MKINVNISGKFLAILVIGLLVTLTASANYAQWQASTQGPSGIIPDEVQWGGASDLNSGGDVVDTKCTGTDTFLAGDGTCQPDSSGTTTSETDIEQAVFDSDNDEGGMNIGGNLDVSGNINLDSAGSSLNMYSGNIHHSSSGSASGIDMRFRGDDNAFDFERYDDKSIKYMTLDYSGSSAEVTYPSSNVDLSNSNGFQLPVGTDAY